jgi:uncharacterized protein (DUF2236 family)
MERAMAGLAQWIEQQLNVGPGPPVDFTQPAGEPSLAAPDSVSWRVFKNPVALFIGGVTAVLLELAEPRVRTGVWEHTTFRDDPLPRMRRTGLAAMVTVYGAQSVARKMIAGVSRMHTRVQGVTPEGQAYRATDPELLDWVQATASYGFLQAYHHFGQPLDAARRDRFYAETRPAAQLYGATGAPASEAEQQALFARMLPQLRAHPIIAEFLAIMDATPALPAPLHRMQPACIRAAQSLLPPAVQALLALPEGGGLGPREARLIRVAGRLAERLPLPGLPAVQACRRLGLPANYLYRSSSP